MKCALTIAAFADLVIVSVGPATSVKDWLWGSPFVFSRNRQSIAYDKAAQAYQLTTTLFLVLRVHLLSRENSFLVLNANRYS